MKLIVAVDNNWAIGYKNQLLIQIPADQRYFRTQTLGKVVVMGRNTLESFPNGMPLRDRTNIVITKQEDYKVKDAIVVNSVEEALEVLKEYDSNDTYVIGGESIYRQMLELCDEAYVTKINYEYEADTYFPNLDELSKWKLVKESEEETYYDLEYTFCIYKRV